MKKTIKRRLDKLWSEIVKELWGKRIGKGKCAVPGCGLNGNNAHHIFSRRSNSVRWLPQNGIVLCPKHHTLGTPSAHHCPVDNPRWFIDYVLHVYYRQSELDELSLLANGVEKMNDNDGLRLEKVMKKYLVNIRENNHANYKMPFEETSDCGL